MTLLTKYGESINSQFEEDGMIHECLRRIGLLESGSCIDVGASDGRECSNTLALRDLYGWRRTLIEADPVLFNRMEDHHLDVKLNITITPTGTASLDSIAMPCHFLSLDIDGEDYAVLECLKMRPALICAEFNPTIPPHLDLVSPQLGCSITALVSLMDVKDYHFVGATHCNALFVEGKRLLDFLDIDRNPEHYLSTDSLTYLISDPYGGVVAFGPQSFGVQKRFVGEINVVGPNGSVHNLQLGQSSARPN